MSQHKKYAQLKKYAKSYMAATIVVLIYQNQQDSVRNQLDAALENLTAAK